MTKIIPLSLVALASLYSAEVELTPISVEATTVTEVSKNAQVSADLAQALSGSVPSIDMNRRSAIANDIYIRGQKKDNISVEVDGTKVCGACPNRMDPPVSHILTNQIDSIDVIEGPYDVETFGTMSGGLKIKTKKPTKDLHGELNFGYGSWNYIKYGATASGGNDFLRVLVSASSESSDQYKDGNGDTIAQQLINNAPLANQLQTKYEGMEAYDKKSVKAKAFVNVTKDQELRLSYTANRSDNVLYGNSKMDAIYDDSNIYSVEYDVKDIADIYENANIQYYYTDVMHPMSTEYRNSAVGIGTMMPMSMTSKLNTSMQGLKFKNSLNVLDHKILLGVDGSQRTWDGIYINNLTGMTSPTKSINDTVTKNVAAFAKLEKSFSEFNFVLGARYDLTNVNPSSAQASNTYKAINANLFTSYNLNNENKVFVGFGQASRVPDARELYFTSSKASLVGTPDLKQTTNQELDLGYESTYNMFNFKVKAFYSKLSDYIYYDYQQSTNAFVNIDASIYGTEVAASVYATDYISIDAGMSYKKGEKSAPLAGQTSTALADIAPLRASLAVNYEYMNDSMATIEAQGSDTWSTFDADNGEQAIAAWSVINMKVKHEINKNFDFTLGVNNILDETYALSNTYADLTLLTSADSTKVLMNEPGRYIYTNLNIKY